MAKDKKELEVVVVDMSHIEITEEEKRIIEEVATNLTIVERVVNTDKIINLQLREVVENTSDESLIDAFEILGIEFIHIETAINLYPNPKIFASLILLSQLQYDESKEDKFKTIHKIVPYLAK